MSIQYNEPTCAGPQIIGPLRYGEFNAVPIVSPEAALRDAYERGREAGAAEERDAHREAVDALRELVETYEEDNPGRPCVVVARRALDAIRARGSK